MAQVYFGEDHRHSPSRCPRCGYLVDASTGVGLSPGDKRPAPDDFTVCINCAAVCRFDPELKLRLARAVELMTLAADQPDDFQLLARIGSLVSEQICERDRHRGETDGA